MKKVSFIILILFASIVNGSCQATCDLKGSFVVEHGRLTSNYQRTTHKYSQNRVTFFKDKLELASGFFYSILSLDEGDWALGRYPFVYYGNKESYLVLNDSLKIYSKPYDKWKSFRIECVSNDEVKLVANRDTVILKRDNKSHLVKNWQIKTIKAHVYEQGLGLYGNNYKLTYSQDNKLTFQQLSPKATNVGTTDIKLKPGTFRKLCEKFNEVNLAKLKDRYTSGESEVEVKEIEIELMDGTKYSFHLENDNYPEDLMLALIPVLYGHQQYVYRNLPVVK